ncbi:carboxypeptidase regulatory-like domain-containing protein [Paraburkholderia guartelaensis]|uniref:carboxypeptidase regulatory-like domain-containing protein n=1 Tax=Paraburkholderia guartelaensis TaxID=2546446 RepID=UPI002AB6F74D|nr:carboxypeptidase regulatory-like domain-containing protein [Paraburkholderia guartelaensis]
MERQRKAPRITSTLLVAACAFAMASSALAQTGMPQTEQQGDISFVSGGVGRDESSALRHARSQWPLSMLFTGPGSSYVADVHVQIAGAGGASVLDTRSHGPYMLVRLPAGRYTITATYNEVTRTQRVNVAGNGSARATFSFPGKH